MIWNFVLGAWIAGGMVFGFLMPDAANLQKSAAMYFHVPMAVTMLVTFFIAAYHGAMWLKHQRVESDTKSLAFAEVGLACGIIAMLSGSVWAGANWNSYWSWDPQQIGIVGTLLTYGALFALRGAVDDETKKRNLWAVYAIVGAGTAFFPTYIFRKLGGNSLHPDDTLTTSSPMFKLALWFNVVGYVFLASRMAILRARLESASLRLKESQWITF